MISGPFYRQEAEREDEEERRYAVGGRVTRMREESPLATWGVREREKAGETIPTIEMVTAP